jgi:phage-related protein
VSNVGYATLQIIPSAKGFGAALDKETRPGMVAAGTAGGKKSGGAFSKAFIAPLKGIAAPLAAVFGAAAVGGFLKSAVTEASDLAEAGNKMQVVFGDATAQVMKFASGGAKTLGQSNLAVQNAAAGFGIYGKAAGLAGDENAKFSTGLVGLSTDLASFYNASPEETVEAIGSALRGEAEPMRRFGVLLDDATLKSRAMEMGLISTTKNALTPQQKILAAHAEILAQTGVAQGDFVRTSDGLANQQRILSAQFTNLKGTLGAALLPAVTAVVSGLNAGLGPAMTFVGQAAGALGPFLSQIGTAFTGLSVSGAGASTLFASLKTTFAAVGEFARGLAPVFQEVAAKITATLLPGLRSVGETLSGTFLPAFRQVLPILQPVAAFIIRTLGTAVTGVITGALNVVKGVLTVIAGVFRAFAALVKGDWSALWAAVKQIVSGVFQAVKGLVQVWWNAGILSVFRAGIGSLKGLWGGLWTNIKSVGSSALNALKGLVSGALNGIKGTVQGAVSAYLGLWKSLFSTLGSVAANGWMVLRSAFGGALAAIRTVVSGALSAIGGAFRSAFSGIASTVSGAISGVIGTLRSLPGAVMGAVKGAGGWLKSAGADVIRGFISGITSMAGRVVSAIRNTITDKLPGFVKDALGIASPSKVFADLGKWTGMGFVEGVEGTERAAQRAMSSVVAPPPPSTLGASASYGSAAAGASQGGPLVQFGDVTLREEVDVDVLAHRMGFALSGHGFGGGNLR